MERQIFSLSISARSLIDLKGSLVRQQCRGITARHIYFVIAPFISAIKDKLPVRLINTMLFLFRVNFKIQFQPFFSNCASWLIACFGGGPVFDHFHKIQFEFRDNQILPNC